MSERLRKRFLRAVLGVSVLLLGDVAWQERHWVLLRNVRVVEPGRVYRGGLQQPGPLRRLIRTQGIRTIVSLRGPCEWEQQIARELGVAWLECDLDAAESEGRIIAALDIAASVLADPSNQPVYFHCIRGWDRSNLVQAAYRIRACGWTVEQAVAELAPTGFDPQADTVDARRLRQLWAFHDTCVREQREQPDVREPDGSRERVQWSTALPSDSGGLHWD